MGALTELTAAQWLSVAWLSSVLGLGSGFLFGWLAGRRISRQKGGLG